MPALKSAVKNAFSIVRATTPAFSGVNGQLSHYDGAGTKSGQKVSEAGALRVAAVWIANTVLADECASLAMRIVKREDKTRQPQQPPKLASLWSDDPNLEQTRFGIEATEVLSMNLWGAAYTMLGWTNAGALGERQPIHPDGVTLKHTERGGLKLCSQGQGELIAEKGERPQFEFVPLYTLPGQLTPVSPVRMAAELAGLSLAYEETAARFMRVGMNPSAVVTADAVVNEEQSKALASRLTSLYGGSGKSGGVAVLGGKDLKIERLTMSMVDAQMIEHEERVFSVLMAMWRIPPTVAGMVDKPSTWGTGIAEFSRGLERFTLRPIVMRRQAAHQKYITRWVDPDLQVKYMFDSLLSASPKDRVAIQAQRIMGGMTSVERVLAQEDEPPFTEDETVYSPLAMALGEDRQLEQLTRQAEAYGALIRAGVTPDAAADATGFDPSKLKHTGAPPVTVQSEDD